MKTKHLLTAMALPLFFAACSQEDIVNESNTTDLGTRKVVGDVTINLSEETLSRMAFVGGNTPYAWEAGDQFGACLMDVPANGAAEPSYAPGVSFWNRFDLVDYVHTNYPFTRQADGSWTSEAVMSEGNYFFYYPFNNNLGGRRSALKLDIPTEQVLADGAKASSALDQQLFVGYSSVQAKVGKEKESITLNMEPLLAFPGFRLKSSGNSTEAITIRKIAFHAGEDFPVQYEIKPATAAEATVEDAEGNETTVDAPFDAKGYETGGWSASDKRSKIVKIAQTTTGKANQVSLVFGEKGKTLKAGQSALGYIMLPPMEKIENPMLYIYTDKGLGRVDLSKANTDTGDSETGVTNIPNDRALTTIAYNDGAIVNIEFDNTAFDQPFSMDVRSTDELVDLVKWSKNNTDAKLTATLVNNNIELDPEVISILKGNSKISLNIIGADKTITVPENSAKDALLTNLTLNVNNLVVAEGANVKLPSLTGSYVDKKGETVECGVKNVTNYGTVELVSANTQPDFYNKGIINITGEYSNAFGCTVSSVANIENWGTVNTNATYWANTIAKLDNKCTGKANFNKGTTTVANLGNDYKDNSSNSWGYKRGEVVVAKGATLNITGGSNKGLVINSGTINGSLKNEANNEDENWSNYHKSVASEIQNAGVVKGITNFGLVTMTSATAHLQSANAINGYVNNNVESPYVAKVADETIFVEFDGSYKASEVADKVVGANAKEVRLSGVLTADPEAEGDGWSYIIGEQEALNVVADGDLTIKGQVSFYSKNKTKNTKFTVNSYTTTDVATKGYLWLGSGKLIVNGTLNINSGATVKANVVDDSNINVYGTLEKVNASSSEGSETVEDVTIVGTTYTVNNAAGLRKVAAGINDGTIENDVTIELAADINLNNQAWTPIGNSTITFNGTFDGKDHTIYGLSVDKDEAAGLFGYGGNRPVIKNVTVDGAKIVGCHYAGVIVGYIYGDIENCVVKNSTVNCNYKNADLDGDKAGALVGYIGEGSYVLENCKAENCVVTASRNAGQLVGYAQTSENRSNNSASGVSVEWNGKGTGKGINNTFYGGEN